jgi:hypothetical protein
MPTPLAAMSFVGGTAAWSNAFTTMLVVHLKIAVCAALHPQHRHRAVVVIAPAASRYSPQSSLAIIDAI